MWVLFCTRVRWHTRGGHKSACESRVSRSALWFFRDWAQDIRLGGRHLSSPCFQVYWSFFYIKFSSSWQMFQLCLRTTIIAVVWSIPKCLFKDLLFRIFINLVLMLIVKLTTKISLCITGAISLFKFASLCFLCFRVLLLVAYISKIVFPRIIFLLLWNIPIQNS